MFRMSYLLSFVLILSACQDTKPAKPAYQVPTPAKLVDISYQKSQPYIGAINRTWSLQITGPDFKRWYHSVKEYHGGMQARPSEYITAGTYEIDGDLAIFTGQSKSPPPDPDISAGFRFAINYGFPPGGYERQRVAFNAFFPDTKGTLTLHRKWFRRLAGQWQPSQEITVTIPQNGPKDGSWSVRVTGCHRLWNEPGTMTEQTFDRILTYGSSEPHPTLVSVSGPWNTIEKIPHWLPTDLVPVLQDGNVVMVTYGRHHILGRFVTYLDPPLAD